MAFIRLRQKDIVWHEVNGSIVCLDIATSRYLNVNPAGASLWPLLLDGTALQDLVERLVAEFGIGTEQAKNDARAFVAMLEERNLLEHE